MTEPQALLIKERPASRSRRRIKPAQVASCFRRRLPILVWLRNYKLEYLYPDFISGITVGLMAIPQCLAYADLAGLPPIYGLYSALFSPFIYCIFGASKDLTISPVSIVSVIVGQYTLSESPAENLIQASSLVLISGLIMVLMGLFRLGLIISFISLPVLSGYVSCVGVSVIVYMMRDLCGLNMPRANFPQTIANLVKHLPNTRPADITLAIGCLVIFLTLQKALQWNNKRKIRTDAKVLVRYTSKLIWFLGTARYALVIFTMTAVAQYLSEVAKKPDFFTLIGDMEQGFPKPWIPIQTYTTGNTTVSASQLLSNIGPGSITLTFVAVLNTLVAVKAAAHINNYDVDMSNEIFTLGLISIAASFFRGLSVAGSLSRTLLNSHCGVKTPLNNIFVGIIIVVSLSVLTSWFRFIPKAALAAMIVTALLPMIDYKMPLSLWKSQKLELIPLFAAFGISFYSPALGLLIAASLHLIIFIYYNTTFKSDIEDKDTAIFVHLNTRNLLYPSAEDFVSTIEEVSTAHKEKPIIVDFSDVSKIDTTAAITIKKMELLMKHRANKGGIYLTNVCDNVAFCLTHFNFDMSLVITPEAINDICNYNEELRVMENSNAIVESSIELERFSQ